MATLPRIDQPRPPRRLTREEQRVADEHAYQQLLDLATIRLAVNGALAAEQRKHLGAGWNGG